jgi:hypothetical protein
VWAGVWVMVCGPAYRLDVSSDILPILWTQLLC